MGDSEQGCLVQKGSYASLNRMLTQILEERDMVLWESVRDTGAHVDQRSRRSTAREVGSFCVGRTESRTRGILGKYANWEERRAHGGSGVPLSERMPGH